jgi:hypothetical protein
VAFSGVPRRVTLTIPANFVLMETLDKHSCVALFAMYGFRGQTAAEILSESLENIRRSQSKETLGSWRSSERSR